MSPSLGKLISQPANEEAIKDANAENQQARDEMNGPRRRKAAVNQRIIAQRKSTFRTDLKLEVPLGLMCIGRHDMPLHTILPRRQWRHRYDQQRFVVTVNMRVFFVNLFSIHIQHLNRTEGGSTFCENQSLISVGSFETVEPTFGCAWSSNACATRRWKQTPSEENL